MSDIHPGIAHRGDSLRHNPPSKGRHPADGEGGESLSLLGTENVAKVVLATSGLGLMPLASCRRGVRGRLSHRKGGGDLAQTQGNEELHNPGDDECQNADLRSPIDEALAKVALRDC
jgi:hypothetical protein